VGVAKRGKGKYLKSCGEKFSGEIRGFKGSGFVGIPVTEILGMEGCGICDTFFQTLKTGPRQQHR